jgi:hypothetical protein
MQRLQTFKGINRPSPWERSLGNLHVAYDVVDTGNRQEVILMDYHASVRTYQAYGQYSRL